MQQATLELQIIRGFFPREKKQQQQSDQRTL